MENFIYLVTAYRLGGLDNVFPIGVFETYEQARRAALEHRIKRGGKYEHRISTWTLGVWSDEQKAGSSNFPTIEEIEKLSNDDLPHPVFPRNPILSDDDYTLARDAEGTWLTVDNISLRILRTEEGIIVRAFPLGEEADDELDSMTVANR
jgi:hypothetical protein